MTSPEHLPNPANSSNLEENVNQKTQALAAEISKPLAFRRDQQVLDMDKLMAAGIKLLKQKMDDQIQLVSSYEHRRIEIVDSYRIRIERLKVEAEDQLREMEERHVEELKTLEKMISKLKALREA